VSSTAAYLLLVAACLVGVAVTPLGLPGTLLILAAAALFAWATGFATVSWPILAALVAIAVVAEVAETVTGAAGARRAGGSRRAAWLAIAGGIVGGILGVPFFLGLGAIPGALAGAFAGAFAGEVSLAGDWEQARRVGWAALVGRAWGIALKGAAAVAMTIIVAVAAWR
jgi:uncharacterized protein YqgC (DUF456 family)